MKKLLISKTQFFIQPAFEKKITARVVMNKQVRMLKAYTDKNNEKLHDISREIRRKAIRRRRQKNQDYREHSLRLNKLMNSKTGIGKTIHALKQIISHVEEAKDLVKLKVKELKKKKKNLLIANPFDFTEYVEKRKEENQIDLGLLLELAAENKIMYNQTPLNTLIEDIEKLKWLFYEKLF